MDFQALNSLGEMFFRQAKTYADQDFLWIKKDGVWTALSWFQVEARVSLLSRGLRKLGVQPGDRVVLAAENRPEWLIAELAIMSAGAITAPAYVTNTVSDHLHILNNVDARCAIVSTRKLARTLLPAVEQVNGCEFVIAMEPLGDVARNTLVKIHEWDTVLAEGAHLPDDVEDMAAQARRGDPAVVIHTSGTGGKPRGVTLSHGALLHNCEGAYHVLGDTLEVGSDVFLSFLPLSHSYEHLAGQFFPISIGAQVYYAEGLDALLRNIAEVRPTIMTAVPRLYEAMYQRTVKNAAQNTGLKKTLFDKAIALGTKAYLEPGKMSAGERCLNGVLEKLVRKKARDRFGGRLKYFVSGGAPLNVDIGVYFTALGIKFLQGYGLTESAPLISVNPPEKFKMHTVGPPVRNTEVRIAEDGEICVRGELVMEGYWGDQAATDEVIKDGWLHTGDVGHLDEDGYIQITDRKKDIIVNTGGDNIAPQKVEGELILQPEIQQSMVHGDKRPHLVALIVPDLEWLGGWAAAEGKPNDLAALADDPDLHAIISAVLDRVNKELSVIERVRKFVIAGQPFTIENEMMTPTMKARRHMIRAAYGEALEALYG